MIHKITLSRLFLEQKCSTVILNSTFFTFLAHDIFVFVLRTYGEQQVNESNSNDSSHANQRFILSPWGKRHDLKRDLSTANEKATLGEVVMMSVVKCVGDVT